MTTLNTIIEEEKFDEKIDTICKQADQYQINAGYPVSTPAKTIILSLFTTAMQRAYEVGKADNAQANTPDTEGGCCKGCKTATNKSEWDKGNVYCSNRECKCHTPETESSKDLTTAEQSHTSVKQNLDTTPDTEWEKEKLAEQLHEWYLEATYQEDAKYNIDAVVPYNDLPEGSKILDRYIAGKIIEMLTSRDTYWKERVRNMVDKKKIVVEDGPLDVDEVYYNKACDDILQALDNLK